jgi:alpha/beta superfamily hydrolase
MTPFFFGDSKSPLFGVFHPPQSVSHRDFGIVICPSIAHEYVRTHKALRQLASALAGNGFPVMRFDYFGVGDSAGESGEGGSTRWTEDIRLAIEEMLALSNTKNACLIGLRMGAALALQALPEKNVCKRLILWDPVVSGLQMFNEMKDMHIRALSCPAAPVNDEEIVGFPYPAALQQDICGLDMLRMCAPGVERMVILYSKDMPQYAQLRQQLSVSGADCTCVPFTDVTDWTEPKSLDKTFIATNAIETIVSVLTGKIND